MKGVREEGEGKERSWGVEAEERWKAGEVRERDLSDRCETTSYRRLGELTSYDAPLRSPP